MIQDDGKLTLEPLDEREEGCMLKNRQFAFCFLLSIRT